MDMQTKLPNVIDPFTLQNLMLSFSEQGDLMWTWKAMWGPHVP